MAERESLLSLLIPLAKKPAERGKIPIAIGALIVDIDLYGSPMYKFESEAERQYARDFSTMLIGDLAEQRGELYEEFTAFMSGKESSETLGASVADPETMATFIELILRRDTHQLDEVPAHDFHSTRLEPFSKALAKLLHDMAV